MLRFSRMRRHLLRGFQYSALVFPRTRGTAEPSPGGEGWVRTVVKLTCDGRLQRLAGGKVWPGQGMGLGLGVLKLIFVPCPHLRYL